MGTSDTGEVQFNLGQHEARLDAMESNISEIRTDMKEVLAIVASTKGSWRTLVTLGSAVAVLVEGTHQLLEWLRR